MMDFETICRVCMNSADEMVLIFDEAAENSVGIATMMGVCSKYKVLRQDGLPQRICRSCLQSLNNAHRWRENCEASYRHLMQLLSTSKTDNHLDIEDIKNTVITQVEKETQTETSAIELCERCDEKFFDLDALRLHRANEHKGSAIVCRFCAKPFNRIGYLRSHIAICHPESGYTSHSQCDICQRKFSRKEHMRRHMAVMHKVESADDDEFPEFDDELDNEVDIAEIEENVDTKEPLATSNAIEPIHTVLISETYEVNCIKLEDLEAEDVIGESNYEHPVDHVVETKSESSSQASSSTSKEATKVSKSKSSTSKKFTCADCKKSYVNETHYKKHCTTKHKEQKYACKSCDKAFARRNELREHLRAHGQKHYTCRECAQNFAVKDDLIAHRKAEGHDKPMLCPECGLRCKSSSSLMAHMRRHNGEKPYKCKFCDKGFPRSDDLKVHEKYHTGEKSHFCDTCGKGFQRKYNLTIHLRVHTGEKPYKCPHCPQAFSQGNDLKSHIRRHTGERFRCEFCDAAFLQGYQIRQHKLTEHGIKEEPPTQRVAKFTSLEQQQQQIKEVQQRQQTAL